MAEFNPIQDSLRLVNLSEEDHEALARLFMLPEYKVLDIHMNNIILSLQNRYFLEAKTLDEFKALQLTRRGLLEISKGVERCYKWSLIKNPNEDDKKKKHEGWEKTPDHNNN